MLLFKQNENGLSSLNEKPFKLEKEIQRLFEQNLAVISDYQLIKSEFSIKNSRIDTLVFDPENNAFVIIEYKRSQNFSVVDQGISYLNLMLENKGEFIVEYYESSLPKLKRDEFDWSQSKVIFVSPAFTDFQNQAANFKDLPIELWEIHQFEKGIVSVVPLKKSKSAPSFKQIKTAQNADLEKVVDEIKAYSEQEHLENKNDEIRELYEQFKEAILRLDTELDPKALKHYIAFKKGKKNLAYIKIQHNSLKIFINLKKGTLNDPKNITEDVSEKGHHGTGDYQIIVKDSRDVEYIMSLIKQTI
ncbi:DUF5655 domain-containing protein [Lonepinella sp. MS14435]|uniref:DUF5655 domain-containing protein n=1 Tax=Lonepinella sp. MS14435 TaxID=3003618 RepID=UPI0036DC4C13